MVDWQTRGGGRLVAEVRVYGTGSFDNKTKTWRLKGKGISRSVRQLNKQYGKNVARTELASRSLWNKYLQDLSAQSFTDRVSDSPLSNRIKSIQAMISRFQLENRPQDDIKQLESMLADCIAVPIHNIDVADVPIVHPDRQLIVDMLGLHGDELAIGLINQTVQTSQKINQPIAADSLLNEAKQYIERRRKTNPKDAGSIKISLDLFSKITGDISIKDINAGHYRRYTDAVKDTQTWGERTKYNHQQHIRTFLQRLETDFTLRYGFLQNKDYQLFCPEGRKEQWTIEQVKSALNIATGDIRLALLLGLNAGLYWSDIFDTTRDHFDNGIWLTRDRVKNRRRDKPSIIGSWLLWDETKELMKFSDSGNLIIPPRTQVNFNSDFCKLNGFPSHKALRKTTAQIIQDDTKHGLEVAMSFRNESIGGGHGKFYSTKTSAEVNNISKALIMVADIFGLKATYKIKS